MRSTIGVRLKVTLLCVFVLLATHCRNAAEIGLRHDAGDTSGDMDTDTNTDENTDSGLETDSHGDVDVDSDADGDTDADGDADTDSNTGSSSIDGGLDCLKGSYDIVSAADMMSFQPYPCITGDLRIAPDELVEIDLRNLVYVLGNLRIMYSDSLESLSGLANLTTVGGDVDIVGLHSLSNLGGLGELASIGGDFEVRDNENMMSLEGFGHLTIIHGEMDVRGNDRLPCCQICALLGRFKSLPVKFGVSGNSEDSCCPGGAFHCS